MNPELHLLITTISYIISMIVVLGFGFFVFFQKEHKKLYTIWFLFCLSMALYQLSFIIGINTHATSKIAYWIWYSNIIEDVFIGLFTLHIFVLATDGSEKFKKMLNLMYVSGFLIILASILFPSTFVVDVVPKAYFYSYIDTTGPLYYIIDLYFLLTFILSYYVLFYQRAHHGQEIRTRIDYYIAGLSFGFITGITAFAPDFNLPIDPGISALVGMFTIPLVYGMMKKGLMDIRIVIRKAVLITSLIISIAVVFMVVSLLSNWLTTFVPGFRPWMIPFLTSFILVIVGFLYYKKEKEGDELKYEFITVVAHKFRTPLTRIRWQTDELAKQKDLPPQTLKDVSLINDSALELIDLSNLLINASRTKQENYFYSYTGVDLTKLTKDTSLSLQKDISNKKINFSIKSEENTPLIHADKDRLASVIHVLIENAIAYTSESGEIEIRISAEEEIVKFSIKDTGIGISSKDQSRVFGGFYRGEQARLKDTEGVGLGLSMAKKIIERQGGSMGVVSEGEGKGSTFYFILPIKKGSK